MLRLLWKANNILQMAEINGQLREALDKTIIQMGPQPTDSQDRLVGRVNQLTQAVQKTYQQLVNLFGYVNGSLDLSTKDPVQLLQLCTSLACQYVDESTMLTKTSNFEERLRELLREYQQDTQSEYAARVALENYRLNLQLSRLQSQAKQLKNKLAFSEQNCCRVNQAAVDTVECMKREFTVILDVLRQTEKKLNDAMTLSAGLQTEKHKVQTQLQDLKRLNSQSRSSSRHDHKHMSVLTNQFNGKIKQIEKAYKDWWVRAHERRSIR